MDINQDNHSRESFDDIILQLDKSLELCRPTVQERKSLEQPSPESDGFKSTPSMFIYFTGLHLLPNPLFKFLFFPV